MRFGTAAHSLLVEGQEAFDKEVVVITGSPYTKANKELNQTFLIATHNEHLADSMNRTIFIEDGKILSK